MFATFKEHTIGDPALPSALFQELGRKLFSIYGKEKETESLSDNDPASEGLARLHIWYLQDYQMLGLLPKLPITSKQNKWLEEAEKALSTRKLDTVADLKRSLIFSKKTLVEYLSES